MDDMQRKIRVERKRLGRIQQKFGVHSNGSHLEVRPVPKPSLSKVLHTIFTLYQRVKNDIKRHDD
jgi:hypothetical protein